MNATGGNVVRFTGAPGAVHTGRFLWRGDTVPTPGTAPHGVPGNHNCVTSDPGVILRGDPDYSKYLPTVDISGVNHVDVIGNTFDGGIWAIRVQSSQGSPTSRVQVSHNSIRSIDSPNIAVQGWWQAPYSPPSAYVEVDCNHIDGSGVARSDPWFNEGIYLGSGGGARQDRTHHVTVSRNHIQHVQADPIEAKPGTTHIQVSENVIHDIELLANINKSVPTGYTTMHYANELGPGDVTEVASVVRDNVLWNLTQNPEWAGPDGTWVFPPISIGFGGTVVETNVVCSFQSDYAIGVRTGGAFSPEPPGSVLIEIRSNKADGPVLLVDDPRNTQPDVVEENNTAYDPDAICSL